jgi:hypothetical protein
MKLSKYKIWARYIARNAVRNDTSLEELHCGKTPESKTGDYSDVYVVTPERKIKWNELSRISDPEMRTLMLEIEKNLIVLLEMYEKHHDDKKYLDGLEKLFFDENGISWDIPQEKFDELTKAALIRKKAHKEEK